VITGLKPYPATKDSGVPWLGEVPEHWEVRRLRNAAEMRVSNVDKHTKDDEQPVRLCNYVDVYKNDRITSGMSFMRATATTDEIERFCLRAGDVLITKDSEAWNDIGVPALVEDTPDDLISGYHLALLRPFPERVDGAYLFRALQSTGVAYQFHVEANGVTRYGLSHGAIKSIWLPLPPLPEQAAIVRFLDHADRRIRRYIRAKQKLIKLLEEQKQAIIHRAVTRGLNPDVRLKPSGVEWLGEVPEHWEVRKLRALFRRHGSGATPPGDSYYGGGIPWVMTGDLKDNVLTSTKRTVNSLALEQVSALQMYRSGSLIVAMYGATIGKTAILAMEACTNQACCVLAEPKPDANVEYLQAVVNLSRPVLIEQSYGGGQPNINAEIVKALRVPVPPRGEQDEIVDALCRSVVGYAIEHSRREIALLREYRTRLIADVVTGKLDLRDAVARLPDDGEELPEHEPYEELPDADADQAEEEELSAELKEVEA
jgi:type I restriction enzyme S subunit